MIFGWRINEFDVKRISEELIKLNQGIKFAVANVDEGQIKIPG